jgi:GTPase SAR1 family protein
LLGQEQFRSFTSSYFREKDGFLVVFSVTDRKSFENIGHWMKEIRNWDETTRVCIVGNKIDVDEKLRVVSVREAEEFVASLGGGVKYMEASAKLNINCAKAFEEIARLCHIGTSTSPTSPTPSQAPLNLRNPETQPEQRNFVCCN